MVKAGKSAVVPRLRFPEFRGSDEWKVGSLACVADFVNEKTSLSDVAMAEYVSTENLLPNYGGVVAASKLPTFGSVTRYQAGDVLISNIRPYLKKVWHANRNGGTSNDVIVVRAKSALSSGFLASVLKSDSFIAYVMLGAKGVKMPRGDIDSMHQCSVGYPGEREQQKIADCLTSLDEVIAAQGRKVEALKTHKRGLTQQLFPREGGILPRLRFSEFRNGPEWAVKPLSDVAENLDNKRVPITESERPKGDVPYYGASGIVDFVKDYLFNEDLLCVSEDGANLVARTSPIAFPIAGKTWVNNHAHVLRFNDVATQKMVEDYLNSIDLRDFITGIAQPKLNRAMLDTVPVLLPEPDERTKIAECLSSLDAKIAGEANVLDTLKTHKKGLMQQLFPSPEES